MEVEIMAVAKVILKCKYCGCDEFKEDVETKNKLN
jgi:hypothetical protein